MATKRMDARPALEVSRDSSGNISLEQEQGDGTTCSIYLEPDQVPTVIQWLEELSEEPEED